MAGPLLLLTPQRASSFSPSTLTGLQIWLRADLGVTKDGSNNVSTWVDQSTNAYSFSGTVSTNKPVWVSSDINSKPAMSFSSGKYFKNAVQPISATSHAFTIWLIVNSASLASGPIPFCIGIDSGKNMSMYMNNVANYLNVTVGDATAGAYPPVRASTAFGTDNTWYALSLTYSGGSSTANYQFYNSNATATTVAANNNSVTASGTWIGAYTNGAEPSGDIAEFILTNAVATSTERTNMQAYINARYGL